jgi:hypothetical protein
MLLFCESESTGKERKPNFRKRKQEGKTQGERREEEQRVEITEEKRRGREQEEKRERQSCRALFGKQKNIIHRKEEWHLIFLEEVLGF